MSKFIFFEALKDSSFDFEANLFQGQTARQSSHPNILFPILSLYLVFMCPLCSIVKYDMHFLASKTPALENAFVGHISKHDEHDPQLSFSF